MALLAVGGCAANVSSSGSYPGLWATSPVEITSSVSGEVCGFGSERLAHLVQAGVRQSGASCRELAGTGSDPVCTLEWTIAAQGGLRPVVRYRVHLAINRQPVATAAVTGPCPDTEPKQAAIGDVVRTMDILRGRIHRQAAAP